MNYYCWHCYRVNRRPQGACVACGGEVAPPAEASYVERLLWELGHPLPDRQLVAAHVLGRLGDPRSREPLRRLASGAADPYLAAEALDSLLALDGVAMHWPLLVRLQQIGPVPVRALARRALEAAEQR